MNGPVRFLRRRFIFTFTFIIWLAWGSRAPGQILSLQTYSTSEGLIPAGVTTLFQDSRGVLWIGTSEGLVQYDGTSFRTFRTTEGLSEDYISTIKEDPSSPGVLWIGTESGGVNILRNGRIGVFPLDSLLRPLMIEDIQFDGKGRAWCVTDAGAYVVDHGRITQWLANPREGAEMNIAIASDGRAWVSTGGLLFIDDSSGRRELSLRRYISRGAFIHCLSRAHDGSMIVGTSDSLVLQFRDTALVRSWRLRQSYASSIACDEDGTIWICGGIGLYAIKTGANAEGAIDVFSTANGLPSDGISCALIDREENLWVGTRKGLVKWVDRSFVRFPITPLEAGSVCIPPAAIDPRGHVWMIAGDGVVEFWNDRQHEWHSHLHPTGREGLQQTAQSIAFDTHGKLWIGFRKGIIQAYTLGKRSSGSVLAPVPDLRVNTVFTEPMFETFAVDHQGRVWCSIEGKGVTAFSPGRRPKILATFKLGDGLPDLSIRAIYEDREGRLWFGGYGRGLAYLDSPDIPGHLKRFTVRDGLPDDHVRAFYEDRAGTIWIGTREGGLVQYARGRFRSWSIRDGLLSNTVWSIAGADSGRLLLGTALGLQLFDLSAMKPDPGVSESRGRPVHACGTWQDKFFWTASTSLEFCASTISSRDRKLEPPPVHISHVEVNGTPVVGSGAMELGSDQNTISIGFVGISFRDERAIRYRWRLLGVEPRWMEPSDQHAITYSGLQPGEYRFEVRAIDRNGIESAVPAELSFTIIPPLWQRLWFRLLLTAGVAIVLFGLYRVRVRRLLEVQRTRMQISRDLHDEISASMSGIASFARAIRTDGGNRFTPGSRKFLSLIATSADEAQEAVGDIIWSLNPENDPWEAMLPKLRRFASDLLESKKIAYSIDIPRTLAVKNLDTQRRRDFWLVYKEMVTNAVRHSQCTEARISIDVVGDREIRLVVRDNGKGFDPSAFGGRHGLRNIQARARQLGGTATVKTGAGLGTRWELRAPV